MTLTFCPLWSPRIGIFIQDQKNNWTKDCQEHAPVSELLGKKYFYIFRHKYFHKYIVQLPKMHFNLLFCQILKLQNSSFLGQPFQIFLLSERQQ